MDTISSSNAKQNFADLLMAACRAPVGIKRHGRVVAIIGPPSLLSGQDPVEALRRARQDQLLETMDRLIRHQRIAIQLLTVPPERAQAMIAAARIVLRRWEAEHLCGDDYIRRWSEILGRPVTDLAVTLGDDLDGWGVALRQNSPWFEAGPDAASTVAPDAATPD